MELWILYKHIRHIKKSMLFSTRQNSAGRVYLAKKTGSAVPKSYSANDFCNVTLVIMVSEKCNKK